MKPIYTEKYGLVFSDETEGAADLSKCRKGHRSICKCEPKCLICGNGEHTAIHGPRAGEQPGSKPWGHRFIPPEA